MTNYSNNPGNCRIDYFKASGKWYMTEEFNMYAHWDDVDINKAIEDALVGSGQWRPHFHQVIMEPYHRNAYPIMFTADD